jgi:hypothetical protein
VRSPFEVDTPFPLQVRAQSGTPLFRGGARSLFAGAVPSALFRVANGVLYLPIYSSAKRGLHHGAALPEPRAVASAAAAAVTATALVELPLEAQLLWSRRAEAPRSQPRRGQRSRRPRVSPASGRALRHTVRMRADEAHFSQWLTGLLLQQCFGI